MLSFEHDSRFESDRVSYMFRCASTYNWDVLNGYCSASLIALYSSLPFHHHIGLDEPNDEIRYYPTKVSSSSSQQEQLYRRRERVPLSLLKQLLFSDQWGNTVLHQACFSKPPVDVVEMLLQIGRHTSPPVLHLASIQSRDGSTALLVASATGAETGVLQALVTPPQPLSTTTTTHKVEEDAALTRHSWLTLIPDNQGSTPLSELCNQYHLSRKYMKPISPKLSNISSSQEITNYQQLHLFFEKVQSILHASNHLTSCWKKQEQDEDPFFMIYTLASISHTCPTELSALVCRLYPQSLSQRHKQTRQLPLHRALSTSLFPYLDNGILLYPAQCSKFQYQQTKLIRFYIDTYPDAVRKAIPITESWETNGRNMNYNQKPHDSSLNHHHNWRSPFCHAIAAGLTWNNYYTFADCFVKMRHDEKDASALRCLAHVAPEALECRDTITGLYPFMLAATIVHHVDVTKKQNSSPNEEKQQHRINIENKNNNEDKQLLDLAHLDTIYNLLQRCPQLVSCATTHE